MKKNCSQDLRVRKGSLRHLLVNEHPVFMILDLVGKMTDYGRLILFRALT